MLVQFLSMNLSEGISGFYNDIYDYTYLSLIGIFNALFGLIYFKPILTKFKPTEADSEIQQHSSLATTPATIQHFNQESIFPFLKNLIDLTSQSSILTQNKSVDPLIFAHSTL